MLRRLVPIQLITLAVLLAAPADRLLAQGPTGDSTSAEAAAQNADADGTKTDSAESAKETVPLDSGGRLPWEDAAQPITPLPVRPVASPREALSDVSDSQLESFFDGLALDPGNPALIQILSRLPMIGMNHVKRFAARTKDVSWPQLAGDPAKHRVEMFRLTGRVERVEREDVPSQVAEIYEYDNYYRVSLRLDDAPHPVVVCARAIPQAWKLNEAIDQPASLYGLFLHLGPVERDDDPAPLVFAAHRIAWHPDRSDAAAGVEPSHVLLGGLGMDVGLFDVVRPRNGAEFAKPDSECFHQLLAALRSSTPEDLWKHAEAKLDIVKVNEQADKHCGRMLVVQGNARRITKIMLEKPDIERFGFQHYYEIDMFVPLERPIRFGKRDDANAPIYEHNFPIQVCVLRLPEGLSESQKINQTIRLPAAFFRLWVYRSQYTAELGKRQVSPVLIGLEPEIVHSSSLSLGPYVSLIALGVFALVLGGIWLGMWRYGRSDRKFERETLHPDLKDAEVKSLDELDLQAKDGPDFSGLP